jgi:hypothetical protein
MVFLPLKYRIVAPASLPVVTITAPLVFTTAVATFPVSTTASPTNPKTLHEGKEIKQKAANNEIIRFLNSFLIFMPFSLFN